MLMKIVFLNRYFFPDHSATSQLLSDLTFHLASQGREVHVITSRQLYDEPDTPLLSKEVVNGVMVQRVWTSRFGRGSLPGRALDYLTFYLSTLFALLRTVSRGDIVVAKTDPPLLSLVVAPVAWLKGARLVNWLQDVFPEVAGAVGMVWARGSRARSHVVLPVPRGPSSRNERSGKGRRRVYIAGIMTVKMLAAYTFRNCWFTRLAFSVEQRSTACSGR